MDIVPIKSQVEALSLSLSLSLSVPLSKIGTRLLASLGSKEKNRNSLACLRNAVPIPRTSWFRVTVPGSR